ncbi:MAG: carbonic anhydrase [Acidobacteriaceae bacterium]
MQRGALTGLATALLPSLGLGQESTSLSPGCGSGKRPTNAAGALKALAAGNKRWATFTQCHPREDAAHRASVVKKQYPFATILSCSDSRVPPELLFDQGVGDLFVARVAGNCAGGTLTESLYYGTQSQYLGSLVLFVLGHSGCGAVSAAIASYPGKDTFQFAKLIYPAVKAALDMGVDRSDPAFVSLVTEQNVILGVKVLQADPALHGLRITGGVYDLATSQVNIPKTLTGW